MNESIEVQASEFIKKHVAAVADKYKAACLTYFTATNSGKDEDYKIASEAQLAREKTYTNKEDFQLIKTFRTADIHDPLLKRQIELLFLSYQSRQIDEKKLEKMVDLGNAIENKFATFRAEIDGKPYTDNQIEEILSTSTDSEEAKKAWLASKHIGNVVAQDVIQIVNMRNEVARSL